jgi:hypothetical protein
MTDHGLDAAMRRFLGVGAEADDAGILGLDERQARVPAAIDAAARSRTEQVRRHPGSMDPSAELVLARIRLAAGRLRGRLAEASAAAAASAASAASTPPAGAAVPGLRSSEPGPPTPPTAAVAPSAAAGGGLPLPPIPPPAIGSSPLAARREATGAAPRPRMPVSAAPAGPSLTAFDRAVLGTLVGHGGWNRRSRARLVALAAAHGVGPRGLMNVMRGLAEHARTGGRTEGVAEIAGDFATIAGGRAAGLAAIASMGGRREAQSAADEAAEVARRLLPELEQEGFWPIAKIAVAVLLVICLGGVILLQATRTPTPPPTTPVQAAGPGSGASVEARGTAAGATATDPSAGPVLVFARIPLLQGSPADVSLLDAGDAMAGLAAVIEAEVRRRLEVPAPPTEATFQRWSTAMVEAARGWPNASASDVRAVRRAAAATIVAAGDRREVVERLIDPLSPPVGPAIAAVDADGLPGPWAGAWSVSVLAVVAADPFAPAAAREACSDLLAASVGYPGAPGTGRFDARPEAGPASVAAAWLDQAAAVLVRSPGPPAAIWERWFEAAGALDAGASVAAFRPRLLVAATQSLLASDVPLGETAVGAGLLGRLLVSIDPPLPEEARDLVRRAHEDEAIANLADVRSLVSILALRRDLPWFRAEMVVPPDATMATRGRFLARILEAWPEADRGVQPGRPLAVDAAGLLQWREVRDAIDGQPEPLTATGRLRVAAQLGELAEAAHLLAAGRLDESRATLESVTRDLEQPWEDRSEDAAARPAVVSGNASADGVWTRGWEETRGRGEAAVAKVEALRIEATSDLGPVDARTLVRIAVRTGNQRAEEAARSVLLEKFRFGPNVATELLDAIPEAPIDRGLQDTVHRYAGVALPTDDRDRWRQLARAAMLEHVASVLESRGDPVAGLERRLRETLDRRAEILGGRRGPAAGVGVGVAAGGDAGGSAHPAIAVGRLADAWLAAASARIAVRPVPAPAEELLRRDRLRRRLASDAMQASVAGLISAAEALAFVVAAEQPAAADTCETALSRARVERDRAVTAVEQWLATERLVVELWSLRMGVGPDTEEAGR